MSSTSGGDSVCLFFKAGEDRRPVAAIAAPSKTRELINSSNWIDNMGELAIAAVKLQLEIYEENKEISCRPLTSLFDATVQKLGVLMEDDPENVDVIMESFNPALARAVWEWHNSSYSVFCTIRSRFPHIGEDSVESVPRDVDEWVLKNEDHLRRRLQKNPDTNWAYGLVSLDHADTFFSSSSIGDGYREIKRGDIDGFKCLDACRSPTVRIQLDNANYAKSFRQMTERQLEGLDWSHIFVAGGIALGSLFVMDAKEQWKASDIDIYIYGLNSMEANKKIEHLFDIFKRNLPTGAPTLVIRNSRTVSFLSNYPHRRFQIILKIVKNPAEVLLNFDLDICAVGFDGEKVYMLPRAARALETGYNVFTMDMVQGHYLGTRRASQEQRNAFHLPSVFKYADRGYGIRFLKSYTDALSHIDPDNLPKEHSSLGWWARKYDGAEAETIMMNMDVIAAKARDYFDRLFEAYMRWTENGRKLRTHYVESAGDGSPLHPKTDNKPIFTHALLDTRAQVSSEPLRRSCLTGFHLFYRHVALWEAAQAGRLHIQPDVWASTTYDDAVYGMTYDELPCYAWDENFSIDQFCLKIDTFNDSQSDVAKWSAEDMVRLNGYSNNPAQEWTRVRRIISGSTVKDIMEEDLLVPIWLPKDFFQFAQNLISEIAEDHKDLDLGKVLEVVWPDTESEMKLVIFRLTPVTIYQQLDRRLDELYEVLWSFMHCNSLMGIPEFERAKLLRRQLGRRALRRKAENEFRDFACWVRRDPGSIDGYSYGPIGQGFWEEVVPYEDD